MLLAVSMGSGVFTAVPAAAENEKINMLGGGNAKLTVRSSVGTSETDRTFDGDFYTSTSLSGYNGIGIFDENGERGVFEGDALEMSYRHSVYSSNKYIITSAVFRLKKGDKAEIKAKMDELLGKRFDKQPMDKPSAGSTFKRPEGAFASALIDQCGLKGFTVGGAQVSEKHAGFVINKGGATCADALELIKQVQDKVKTDTGFTLEPEVEILKK